MTEATVEKLLKLNVQEFTLIDNIFKYVEVGDFDDWKELDLNDGEESVEDLVDELHSLFDEPSGRLDMKSLAREVYLDNPDIAKFLHDELSYWINHEPNTKG